MSNVREIMCKPDGSWHLTQEEADWLNGAADREAELRAKVEELMRESAGRQAEVERQHSLIVAWTERRKRSTHNLYAEAGRTNPSPGAGDRPDATDGSTGVAPESPAAEAGAPPMRAKLDEIAESLRLTACTQDDIRAALDEAYDLGRADERRKIRILAALDARETDEQRRTQIRGTIKGGG